MKASAIPLLSGLEGMGRGQVFVWLLNGIEARNLALCPLFGVNTSPQLRGHREKGKGVRYKIREFFMVLLV
jgi:hypothetical protein